MRRIFYRRVPAMVALGVILALAVAVPIMATPKDAHGDHKITICHVTNSHNNPFVVINIDVAAFDGEGKNDHTHHVSKDGRVDVLFVNGECQTTPPTPPTPPTSET
ncbi:MAG: hypothetical protein OEM94_02265 [Acidimicrobiia bacterium]|nr:hypothetical protein [Acidimicrobiia bacterium]